MANVSIQDRVGPDTVKQLRQLTSQRSGTDRSILWTAGSLALSVFLLARRGRKAFLWSLLPPTIQLVRALWNRRA